MHTGGHKTLCNMLSGLKLHMSNLMQIKCILPESLGKFQCHTGVEIAVVLITWFLDVS